jgi:hypothetical protein
LIVSQAKNSEARLGNVDVLIQLAALKIIAQARGIVRTLKRWVSTI